MSTAQTMSHSTGCPSCMSRLVRSSQTRVRYEGSRLKCLWQGSPASEAGELEQVSTARGPQLVRAAAGESGPTLQRPGARQVAQPEAPSRPERKEQESNGTSKLPPPSAEPSGVTVEYQRRQAKDMTAYFRSLVRTETVQKSQVLGWTRKNEITNGRWVMFGLLVGLMTEFATGVDFPNQIKLLVSYLGIYDIYD